MEAIFAQHGPHAIAVKAQHAYNRTLRWEERSDADAERVLQRLLQGAAARRAEPVAVGRLVLGAGHRVGNRIRTAVQNPHWLLRWQRPHAR